LELKSDFRDGPSGERAQQLQGHRFFVPPGGEMRVVASPVHERCEFSVQRADGRPQSFALASAQCQFKVLAERVQSGWARLEFLPQVTHGREYLRRTADESGWRFETAPRVETFLRQRFSVSLAEGEMVLMTARPDARDNLACRFFLAAPEEDGDGEEIPEPQVQRLIVVRLAATHEAEP